MIDYLLKVLYIYLYINILADSLETLIENKIKEFDQRFENTFKLTEKGFNDNQIKFAQAIMSNLLGGIGLDRFLFRIKYYI